MGTYKTSKRKLKTLPLKTKIELIEAVEKSGKKQKTIAEEYGIPQNTVSTIMKKKDHYRQQFYSGHYDINALRIRHGLRPDLEGNLPYWFLNLKAAHAAFSLPFLTVQDNCPGTSSVTRECRCNEGWVDSCYRSSELLMTNNYSDIKAVDLTTTQHWRDNALQTALTRYRPSDIFFVGETGLFWRLLPDKTMAYKFEMCQAGQEAKDRLTVLYCTNIDGSEKWPLLVVGKFQTPRCFKGLKTLPTKYAANYRAWMSQTLFLSWLQDFDSAMVRQQRKALLMLDSNSVHSIPAHLQATELLYLSHKPTSRVLPYEVSRAVSLKTFYRSALLSRLQVHINQGLNKKNFSISLLDALNMLSTSWSKVTPQIVQNSFRFIGFKGPFENSGFDRENYWHDVSYQKLQISKLCEGLGLSLTAEDIISVDDHLLTCPIEVVDISMAVSPVSSPQKEENDDLGDEAPEITQTEAISSTRNLLLFLLQKGCSDEINDLFTRLEVALETFQINVINHMR